MTRRGQSFVAWVFRGYLRVLFAGYNLSAEIVLKLLDRFDQWSLSTGKKTST